MTSVDTNDNAVGSFPDSKAIRKKIAEMSAFARSAHFGSSLSCVEILNAIVSVSDLRTNTSAGRDRLIMSKGHAAMAYYAVLHAHGLIASEHLEKYLLDGTAIWGHVTRTPQIPVIDASTGSLGHGNSLAVGYALAYRLKKLPGRIFCVLSDGELDEGSTWEAILFAGSHKLDNLVNVIDYNKIQSLDRVNNVMSLEPLVAKWQAFGWATDVVDGHDIEALCDVLRRKVTGHPRVIIANTVKGKGVPRIEDTVASHYQPAKPEDAALFS